MASTTLVPVVCLVPQKVADRIAEWATDPTAVAALAPLAETMARSAVLGSERT